MTESAINLIAMRTREQAATDAAPDFWDYMPAMTEDMILTHRVYDNEGRFIAEANNPANADFIAHARQDVPALLAMVDSLTAQLATAKGTTS
jgi:hypothetical protein